MSTRAGRRHAARCAERGKERDGTAKISGKDFSGDWELGRGTIFERIELNDEKDFEMEFFSERFILDEFYGCYTSGVKQFPYQVFETKTSKIGD